MNGDNFCSSCRSRRRLEVGDLDGCQLRRVQGRAHLVEIRWEAMGISTGSKPLPQAVSEASGSHEASLSGTAWNRPGARGCEASPLHPKAAAEWYLRQHARYPRWDTKWTGWRTGYGSCRLPCTNIPRALDVRIRFSVENKEVHRCVWYVTQLGRFQLRGQ